MSGTYMNAGDIVAAGYSASVLALAAASVFLLMGTAWVRRGWKLPILLTALAALVGTLCAYETRASWVATGVAPVDYFYAGWLASMPLQIAALYFAVRQIEPQTVSLFWRLIGVTALMVAVRYLGDARFLDATLSFLLGIVLWLYVLGELFFGRMDEAVTRARIVPLRRGYFWLRLIVAVGWAIYPLVQFLISSNSGISNGAVGLTLSLAEFPNRIAFGLALLTVAVMLAPAEAEAGR